MEGQAARTVQAERVATVKKDGVGKPIDAYRTLECVLNLVLRNGRTAPGLWLVGGRGNEESREAGGRGGGGCCEGGGVRDAGAGAADG